MSTRALAAIAFGTLIAAAGCSQSVSDSPLARGKALLDEGKWEAAIDSLSEAVAKNPFESEGYLLRGQAYMCRGREYVSQALADFNEAIRLNPENCEAYYNRALAYRERREKQKALTDELTARRLDPNAERAGRLHGGSVNEYRLAIERATTGRAAADKTTDTATPSTDAEHDAESPENLPIPSIPIEKSPPAGISKSDNPASASPGAASTEIRDAYGLPLSPRRSGSVTEDLFGIGASQNPDSASEVPSRRSSSPRRVRTRAPSTNWEDDAPQGESFNATAPTASRPSPIGTLPFGNPYQPRNYSPYSGGGPRSTGLRGDPTLRNLPQQPSYDRRQDPNAVRAEPGLQGPLLDPR